MDKQPRGNLDDVVPPAAFGTRASHFLVGELLFWLAIAFLWLAIEGGVIGFIVTLAVGVFVALAWRDIARRAKSPIPSTSPHDREGP